MSARHALLGLATLSCLARAQTALPEAPRRSLQEFMDLAEKQGPQLDEQRGKIEFASAREEYARSKGLPFGKIETLLAPAPAVEGDAVHTRVNWDKWGPWSSSAVELVQPLYTFGAISSGKRAARAGREAEEMLLEKEKWALRLEVAQYYYGYQLAFELSDLGDGVVEDLQKAYDKARKRASRSDIDKLSIYLNEAKARVLEARKGMDQARAAMAWKIGRYGQEVARWDHANLQRRPFALQSLDTYKKICIEHRPELKALQKNEEAKLALVDVQTGLSYPSLFVAGRAGYAIAPHWTKTDSSFLNDTGNYLSGGLGVGLRWDLGLFERSAERSQARAEVLEAQGRHRHWSMAILVEVEKNYLDLKQAQEAFDLREASALVAKRGFRDLAVAYTLGTSTDAKGLLEAMGQHVVAEKNRLEAIYEFNMAVNRLEQSIGQVL
ncbi:MAG: TolC family protein [Bdellovibrionales bacterium]|nr:TolC family protein [Bdellovibrionales bacterium]